MECDPEEVGMEYRGAGNRLAVSTGTTKTVGALGSSHSVFPNLVAKSSRVCSSLNWRDDAVRHSCGVRYKI